MCVSVTHCGNLLVEAFTGVMQEVFQHFGHLKESEARFALLGWMVSGWTRRSGCSQKELLLFILFQQQVVKEAFLGDGPVQLLQTTVGEELAQVDAVVHKEAHKVWFVIDERIHHHFFEVTSLCQWGGSAIVIPSLLQSILFIYLPLTSFMDSNEPHFVSHHYQMLKC